MNNKIIFQNKLLFPEIIWQRPVHYYKLKAGRILVVASSRGQEKAALLVCEAAFRSGTGIITLAFPEELKETLGVLLPDAMQLALPQTYSGSISRKALETIKAQLKDSDLVIIGPGISTNSETVQFVWEILKETNITTILDSDGLLALIYGIEAVKDKRKIAELYDFFKKLSSSLILILSLNEAAKIAKVLNFDKKYTKLGFINKHKIECVKLINNFFNCTIVLRGKETVIIHNNQIIVDKIRGLDCSNTGSENILSGILVSFLAQNPTKRIEAISTAVYLYSLSCKLASENSPKSMSTVSDILKFLPKAIKLSESSL